MGSLTLKQTSIIIGSALGDGSLRKADGRKNALLEVNHAFRYKPYVDWKYKSLANIVNTAPKKRKGNGTRIAYRFTTLSKPELTEIYNKFYVNGKKIIPSDLVFDPLILAVWVMDDGSKTYNAMYLNSQQFSIQDQKRLLYLLKKQYNLEGTLNKDKCYYRIRILARSNKLLKRMIKPYILPIFEYKIE